MTTRPRLLFLAYYYPPVAATACVRTANIAKYFARKGWAVGVVTPAPELWGRVSKTWNSHVKMEGIQLFSTSHAWPGLNNQYLNSGQRGLSYLFWGLCRLAARRLRIEQEVGWAKSVRRMLPELGDWRPDIILASGGPFVSHRLAEWLARQETWWSRRT